MAASTSHSSNSEIPNLEQIDARFREQTEILETINRVGRLLAAELDLEKLVQGVTDAATEITGAQFGAFFYNVIAPSGESYMLYTIAGVPRERFARFPMPRNTDLFGPTFRGEGVIRIDDVHADPRYGHAAPYYGMPEGHLPVTSYLAVPVVARSGEVIGGLFFGHAEPGVFTERHEQIVVGLAAQAAVAMDNARLFEAAKRERGNAALAEQRYRDLVQGLDAVVWEADLPNRQFTFVSFQIERFSGYPAEQWLSDPELWLRIVHPDDRERVWAAWQEAVSTSAAYSCEYRVVARDGRTRWLRDFGVVRAQEGQPCRSQGLITDVTEAWQAAVVQQRRAHQVALLADIGVALTEGGWLSHTLGRCAQAIVEHLRAAFARIWILNPSGDTLELQASAGLYTHLDGPHGRVPVGSFKIGRIAQERQPHLTNDVANDPQVSDQAWARETGMVAFAGYPLLVEDRLVGVLAMFAKEPLDQDTLDALAAVADSIAQGIERKQIEAERAALLAREQAARVEAEALQQRFALLAEMSAELASSLDYETTLRKVADLAVPVLADWCAVDMLDQDGELRRLAVVHSDPAKIQLAYEIQQRYPPSPNPEIGVHHVIRTGEPELMREIPDELLVASAQNEEHLSMIRQLGLRSYLVVPLRSRNLVLGALTLVFAESGRLYDQEALQLAEDLARRAATAVDNARLYRAERQLNEELEQRVRERTAALETAMKELDAFSYSVSHDLRTPLRSLDGFSLALLEDYNHVLDSEGQDYLRRIRAASQRMDRLINDLLQLSRVSRREIVRVPVDLSALAEATVAELRKQYPNRHVHVEIATNLVAEGDRSLLQLVVENLLHNSWKFTAKRADPWIEFGSMVQAGRTLFFVRDNGAGFDMAYADKLFSAFQRLHTEKEFPGTGVGLATVYRIIRRHGGELWAEGAIDQGATFYFTL